MAFKLASRTREQTTTTGTGTIQLGGLLHPTERLFIDAIGDGNQTSYVILSGDGTSVEEGIGTVAAGSPPTLARRVLRSTNGDALVALTGTSTVYCADVPNLTPAAGPTWHAAIAVATTGALPACTYANGVAGRGATLTGNANGALTIDGVALIAGFRVLVKDQVAPAQNGIYLTTQPGAAGAPFILTRAFDYDDEVEIYEGDCVAVGAAGQSNGRTLWTMFTAAASIVIGTADINWSLIGIRNSEGLDLIGATPGDMLVRGATDWIALAPGPDGDVLTMASGAPGWAAAAGGGGGGGAVSAGGPWDMTAAYPVASVVRYHGAFYQSNAAISSPAPATPTLDGSLGAGGQGSSVSWTGFSTTLPNDVLIAVIAINSSTTITSPPSIPGAGTFTRIAQQITGADTTEVWWAPAPTVITNQSLTVGFSANTDHGLSLQAIHGASLVAPFDLDPTLPAKANGSAVTAKTTNAYDFVIYWHRGNTVSFGTYLTPAGFTVLDGTAYVPVSICTSYQSRTTVMPSTVLDAASGAEHCGVLAITSPVNPPPPTDARWVLMAIADSAALDGAYGTTPGTILYRGPNWAALAPGSTAQILTMVGGVPAWANAPSGGGGGLFAPMLSNIPTQANTGLSTWVNQGTATVADTPVGLSITSPGQSGNSLRMLTKAAPTAPYTITVLVANNGTFENYNSAGIGWSDGTKIETINIGFTTGAWSLEITRWNSVTSFNTQDLIAAAPPTPVWFQISDDGTTVYFRYSVDGYNFVTLYKTTKAAGFLGSSGYSNIIFEVNRNLSAGTEKAVGTLLSYAQT